jgi:hypothetical protein
MVVAGGQVAALRVLPDGQPEAGDLDDVAGQGFRRGWRPDGYVDEADRMAVAIRVSVAEGAAAEPRSQDEQEIRERAKALAGVPLAVSPELSLRLLLQNGRQL